MAKGPIGIIAVLLPIGFQLIYLKKWHEILNFRWALVFAIIALLLVPMSYGLYRQFDLHPEKISYGIKGQSGLYFYYWLQSFGRITGENVWNNNTPWHFFLASSLWDFFPWFLPLLFAIFYKLKRLLFQKKIAVEIICLSGFIMIFIMLSMSKYKLPHYVFVTFPFAAILVADYFSTIGEKSWRNWRLLYVVLSIIVLLLVISYYVFFFTEINIWLFACVILQVFIIYKYFYKPQNNIAQLIFLTIMLNVFLTFEFYPKLLNFQADAVAAKYVFQNLKNEDVYLYNAPSHSFSFYTKNPFVKIITKEQFQEVKHPFWLYLSEEELSQVKNLELKITRKISFQDYPITQLKINFLLVSKRQNELKHKFLIKIEKIK